MKRWFSFSCALLLLLPLSACTQAPDETAPTQPTEQAEVHTNDAKTTISGSFTVSVFDVIPEHPNDTAPTVAVVSEFQRYPVTVYVGEEIARQLESADEPHVFTIAPVTVGCPKEDVEAMELSSIVWEFPEIRVTEVRLAKEDELGLASLHLTIE